MPKRKTTRRVNAQAIQGDGAWVEIRVIKYGEAKQLARESESLKDKPEAEQSAHNDAMIARYVAGWNWVGDNGDPLPLPSEQPSVLDDLTADEMAFIAEALAGESAQKKR